MGLPIDLEVCHPSVLLHCLLGHLICKSSPRWPIICRVSEWDVEPYNTIPYQCFDTLVGLQVGRRESDLYERVPVMPLKFLFWNKWRRNWPSQVQVLTLKRYVRTELMAVVSVVALLARTASRCPRAYILPLFLVFLSTLNRGRHWTHLNLDRYSLIWLLFEKIGLNSPGHLPLTGWGQKPLYGTDFWLQWNMISSYQQSERNWAIYRDSPTCPKIWSTPPHLPHERYIGLTDNRQTLACVM